MGFTNDSTASRSFCFPTLIRRLRILVSFKARRASGHGPQELEAKRVSCRMGAAKRSYPNPCEGVRICLSAANDIANHLKSPRAAAAMPSGASSKRDMYRGLSSTIKGKADSGTW